MRVKIKLFSFFKKRQAGWSPAWDPPSLASSQTQSIMDFIYHHHHIIVKPYIIIRWIDDGEGGLNWGFAYPNNHARHSSTRMMHGMCYLHIWCWVFQFLHHLSVNIYIPFDVDQMLVKVDMGDCKAFYVFIHVNLITIKVDPI